MRIISQMDVAPPIQNPQGETIYELIGHPAHLGGTTHHSLAHVVIPSGKSSSAHYHKFSEETYYILTGKARLNVNGEEFILQPGQACLIVPSETHTIFNDDVENLEFLVVSAPAWTLEDSVFV